MENRPRKKTSNDLFTSYVSSLSGFLSRISILIFCLSSIYLTVVFFGANIRRYSTMSLSDQFYFAAALKWVGISMVYSGYVAVICSTVAYYKDYIYSRIIFVAGLFLLYILPYVMYYFTPSDDFKRIGFLSYLINIYMSLGKLALIIGVILLIKDLIIDINNAIYKSRISSKHHTVKSSVKDAKFKTCGLNTKCWETVYCSSEMRSFCPAIRQNQNCWKLGTGCCDEAMFLLASDSAYSKRLLDNINTKERDSEEQLKRCKNCHIFMTHQRHKYKILSPMCILLSLAIGWFVFASMSEYLKTAIISIDKFVGFLSNNPSFVLANNDNALMFFIVILVVAAVIALMTLSIGILNYLIFKLKI